MQIFHGKCLGLVYHYSITSNNCHSSIVSMGVCSVQLASGEPRGPSLTHDSLSGITTIGFVGAGTVAFTASRNFSLAPS